MDFGQIFSGIILIALIVVAVKAAEYNILEAVFFGLGLVFAVSHLLGWLIFGASGEVTLFFALPCCAAWVGFCLYFGHKDYEERQKLDEQEKKDFQNWKAEWRKIREKKENVTTKTSSQPSSTPLTPKPSRVAEYRREYQPTAYRKYRSYLSKEELGKRYERYCGYLLEKDGWEVEYSGIVRGQKDEGIDLRAYSQGRMVAAQCKFWGSGRGAVIRSKTISQFIGDLDREVSENPSLQVIGIFFAKNNNFDTGCKERLESKGFWVQIKDYDNQYPCVKCIAASGLYYVPQHRNYDNLRFSIHRGDRHCDDEAEAEKLGFREAE